MTTAARIPAKRSSSVSPVPLLCLCVFRLKTVFCFWVDWRRSVLVVAGVLAFLLWFWGFRRCGWPLLPLWRPSFAFGCLLIGCSVAGVFGQNRSVLRPVFVDFAQSFDFQGKSWGRNYRKTYRVLTNGLRPKLAVENAPNYPCQTELSTGSPALRPKARQTTRSRSLALTLWVWLGEPKTRRDGAGTRRRGRVPPTPHRDVPASPCQGGSPNTGT